MRSALSVSDSAASPLWPALPTRLYCVLDAAQDPRIYPALRELVAGERIEPLYEGQAASELAAAGPYLIELHQDGAAFDWLLGHEAHGWGMIFVVCSVSIDELRSHLRRLIRVRLSDGRVVLFRFYDPEVIEALLPSFDAAQLDALFGPIEAIRVMMDGGGWREYSRRGSETQELQVSRIETAIS